MAGTMQLHVVMYPWFAVGHLTPFLRLANKLAEKNYRVSFFVPTKTLPKLQPLNLFPDLISLIPLAVPHVEGLPPGAETTADIPIPSSPLLMAAMDLTQPLLEASLLHLKPHIIFFDFAHWIPALTSRLGIKSIHYCVISPVTVGYLLSPARKPTDDVMQPPPGFPRAAIKLHAFEARALALPSAKGDEGGISFVERKHIAMRDCDALSYRTCRELEGAYCDYVGSQFRKPVLLTGPVIPDTPTEPLEEGWAKWLDKFSPGSVVYCAFGSECVMEKDQFQELVLGLELTGLPFFVALKPPSGSDNIEEALPEGFKSRVIEQGRAVVHGGWVQQLLILRHPSVGCFLTHCGYGSMWEALVSECQLVLLPHTGDQFIHARMLGDDLKVGVEVEKGEEDGRFKKESVCNAVQQVMEEDSAVGKEFRANHGKWRELMLREGFVSSCIDDFVEKMQDLHG